MGNNRRKMIFFISTSVSTVHCNVRWIRGAVHHTVPDGAALRLLDDIRGPRGGPQRPRIQRRGVRWHEKQVLKTSKFVTKITYADIFTFSSTTSSLRQTESSSSRSWTPRTLANTASCSTTASSCYSPPRSSSSPRRMSWSSSVGRRLEHYRWTFYGLFCRVWRVVWPNILGPIFLVMRVWFHPHVLYHPLHGLQLPSHHHHRGLYQEHRHHILWNFNRRRLSVFCP